jgi:hypothetical protein
MRCGTLKICIGIELVFALLACREAPLLAQSVRGDLTTANRYIWRGINRSTNWVGQVGLSAAVPIGRGALGVGLFDNRELSSSEEGEITEVGVGEKGLGERDWWLEYRRPLGSQEIFLGFTRYTFHGDEQIGGRSSSNNTTELSFGFQSKLTYLAPTLAAYWDVDRVNGLYIEASGAVPLLAWPYPPPVSLVLDAALGLNLGEDPHPGHPEELAYYAEDGFTHFQLGLSVDLHVAGSLTANGGARVHAGIDDAAKIGTSGQSRSLFVTFWLGATARWGKR